MAWGASPPSAPTKSTRHPERHHDANSPVVVYTILRKLFHMCALAFVSSLNRLGNRLAQESPKTPNTPNTDAHTCPSKGLPPSLNNIAIMAALRPSIIGLQGGPRQTPSAKHAAPPLVLDDRRHYGASAAETGASGE